MKKCNVCKDEFIEPVHSSVCQNCHDTANKLIQLREEATIDSVKPEPFQVDPKLILVES